MWSRAFIVLFGVFSDWIGFVAVVDMVVGEIGALNLFKQFT